MTRAEGRAFALDLRWHPLSGMGERSTAEARPPAYGGQECEPTRASTQCQKEGLNGPLSPPT